MRSESKVAASGDERVGSALARSVDLLRARLGPTAPIAVLTPSSVNGTFARQSLGAATAFIRVSFSTPAQLHAALAAPALRRGGLRPPPPGWSRAVLAHLLHTSDLGPHGEVVRSPGWLSALVSAVETLEAGGVDADILRGLAADDDLKERATLLATLMEGLAEARARDRVAGPAAEAAAARGAILEAEPGPANEPRGVVVLGDARSARRVADTLQEWLASREVVRVGLAPLEALPPARGGARAARPDAALVPCAPPTPEVRMVRTPDPVREQSEIVRRVMVAVREEVPFDRIAVVLPDPSDAVALREALGRAGVPATWMTGPPLSSTPASGLLLHALRLAAGEDTVASWYELLARPGLRLRVLGAQATAGRGRWRRILSRCGAYRGTSAILRALRDTLDEAEPEAPDAAATTSLVRAIDHFRALFASWQAPRALGAWARAWLSFLGVHARDGVDTFALRRLLEGWSGTNIGPAQSLSEAAATLDDTLRTTQETRGSLRDPAIRVLSPMQCLGADFDLVCVASMTEGRFPVRPSEDPILSDALIDAIERHVDAGLFRSGDRVALERRRFAAVRSAARGELWVSCPGVDMMKGRPLLPGALLFELAEEVHGRRLGFDELEAELVPVGRRSRPFPHEPEAALDAAEHLLARLREGDAATRRSALAALADHPTAARLLRAYRAADRIRAGLVDPTLRPYAGFVPPEVLPGPGLDGRPLSPAALGQLLEDPATFFVRRVLGAWPAPTLREEHDPVRPWHVQKLLAEAARALLTASGAELASELLPRFEAAAAAELERAGVDDATTMARLRRLGAWYAERLVAAEPQAGPPLELSGAAVDGAAPWRVEGASARRVGSSLEWLVDSAPTPAAQGKSWPELAELAAAHQRGDGIDEVRWVGLDGSERTPKGGPGPLLEGFRERLAQVTEMVEAGAFPGDGPQALRLDASAESAVDEGWWQAWRH